MKIVVSRYNENVEWTKQFPNLVIYNKGDTLGDDYTNEILLHLFTFQMPSFMFHKRLYICIYNEK